METKYEEVLYLLEECVKACNHCFDACLKEKDVRMMAGCIRLDRECAESCSYTIQVIARRSPFTSQNLRLSAEICEACAEECGKHDHPHCQKCAEACRKCAEACRRVA
ncbi:four-helix bundle copper-binding protein [Sporosarcina sp. PTS2304]|uniref:four-helix bundle copper-binding protein n=1 Tax=Sporosarcina sp. PTS2304 TaxID=2283194 RepID=UPI000E0CC386|nr:four-helix bundle copper-binding protein [Sporosarcina sp. PTS2304]AXI00092.1 four-helix bundle copper-binding protein [Sporosarcina sp. PTS2304]